MHGKHDKSPRTNKQLELSQFLNAYRYCRLSNQILQKPIVSDGHGNLYNKEKVIEYLLDKRKTKGKDKGGGKGEREEVEIESINDVFQLNIDLESGLLKCPLLNNTVDVTKDDKVKLSDVQFAYIVPCGCTMNSKILRELVKDGEGEPRVESKCPVCGTEFDVSNIIEINPQSEKTKAELQSRMERLRKEGFFHNLKARKSKTRCKLKPKPKPKPTAKTNSKRAASSGKHGLETGEDPGASKKVKV